MIIYSIILYKNSGELCVPTNTLVANDMSIDDVQLNAIT